MRVSQSIGRKGSLKWLQQMLAKSPSALDEAVRVELTLPSDARIEVRSPRAEDDHAEYRDGQFLDLLGLSAHRKDLEAFWPSRGPQWDALGIASSGQVILVEAKAHISEIASTCAAGERSRRAILRALEATKAAYGARRDADWTTGFYQYANRLAHLHFLRSRGVNAHLVFVYFLNDRDMRGPTSANTWAGALDECYAALGLPDDPQIEGLHSIFVDVS